MSYRTIPQPNNRPDAARHIDGGRAPQKPVVQDEDGLCVAKFNRADDRWNNTRVARECGITAAESRIETVGGKDVLLIKRFDREKTARGYTRAHGQRRDDPARRWSARSETELVLRDSGRALHRIVEDAKKDAKELFRRVCFNALISNIDDHPRNQAIIAKEKSWKLSPAYDLPVSVDRRDLALDCGDMGRYANAKNILSQHARFLLDRTEAEKIVNYMKAQVEATCYETVRASGVSEKDAETIRGAFVYTGFSLWGSRNRTALSHHEGRLTISTTAKELLRCGRFLAYVGLTCAAEVVVPERTINGSERRARREVKRTFRNAPPFRRGFTTVPIIMNICSMAARSKGLLHARSHL
jgi:hypothetical protein